MAEDVTATTIYAVRKIILEHIINTYYNLANVNITEHK